MYKTLSGLAVATILLLASCGDDGDSSGFGQSPPEAGAGPGQGPEAEGGANGTPDGEPQSFCAWYTWQMHQFENWESLASGSVELPGELDENLARLIRGDASSYDTSAVRTWARENCLFLLVEEASAGGPQQSFCDWFTTTRRSADSEWEPLLTASVSIPDEIVEPLYDLARGEALRIDNLGSPQDVERVDRWVDDNC